MPRIALLTLLLALLIPGGGMSQPAPASRLLFHGKPVYLNGINVPWNNFGADFGCRYDERYFERMFRELRQYGVNSVRVWLHIDGRCQPVFAEGMTVGLTSRFYEHFDDFLARAQRYNIAVMPVLWSFDMTYQQTLRSPLITDVAKTNSYIEKALIPMVKRYATHKALLAWEIINEPEWSIKETPCNAAKHDCVSLLQMQRFVGLQAAAIRANTAQYVTVGS
ncbi:MAG: cellulase family glycosylhydrolase, partial [Meiothermus sp.]|nr:cellulase family glycosylhydrolase [Meiothermus sp.]